MTDKISYIGNLNPHYTNEWFKTARTVWLADGYTAKPDSWGNEHVSNASYEYSDRLWQWNWDKSKQATDAAREQHDSNCAAFFETYLRLYFDAPDLELVHILAGFNLATGYPYRVYGFIRADKNS